VLTVTPISDQEIAAQIAEFIRRENQMVTGGYQQLGGAEVFLQHLQEQFGQLRAAYAEFGSERSGATFVIRQIQNAIGYFKNPVLGGANQKANVLDE
jgi:folylpolyglutamate synthase/dihydropteroate synthase